MLYIIWIVSQIPMSGWLIQSSVPQGVGAGDQVVASDLNIENTPPGCAGPISRNRKRHSCNKKPWVPDVTDREQPDFYDFPALEKMKHLYWDKCHVAYFWLILEELEITERQSSTINGKILKHCLAT